MTLINLVLQYKHDHVFASLHCSDEFSMRTLARKTKEKSSAKNPPSKRSRLMSSDSSDDDAMEVSQGE